MARMTTGPRAVMKPPLSRANYTSPVSSTTRISPLLLLAQLGHALVLGRYLGAYTRGGECASKAAEMIGGRGDSPSWYGGPRRSR